MVVNIGEVSVKFVLRLLVLCIAAPLVFLSLFSLGKWGDVWYWRHSAATKYFAQYTDLSRRDGEVDLIPGLFRRGMSEAEVLDIMKTTHFKQRPVPSYSKSTYKFHKSFGTRNFVCGNEVYIDFVFDDEDELVDAKIQQVGACL